MRRAVVLGLLLILSAAGWAQNSEELTNYRSAVMAIGKGDDQRALRELDRLQEDSFGSLYNRGLVYRNLGDLPRARAAFEQALIRSPRSLSARRRLRELHSRLETAELERLDVKGTPWLTRRESELLVMVPALLLFAGLLLRRNGSSALSTGGVVGCCLLSAGLCGLTALTNPPAERAVVVDRSAKLLSEPSGEAKGRGLPPGVMVEVTERREHYLGVRLGDESTGWLRAASVAELLPQEIRTKAAPTDKPTAH